MEMKISDTGWICVKMNGKWTPTVKLTEKQLVAHRDAILYSNKTPASITSSPAYYKFEGGFF